MVITNLFTDAKLVKNHVHQREQPRHGVYDGEGNSSGLFGKTSMFYELHDQPYKVAVRAVVSYEIGFSGDIISTGLRGSG